jgi:predicted lactoylglutathione lyase
MNAIGLVRVDKLEDLPAALHALAQEVEVQIKITGTHANAIGGTPLPNGAYVDFDYSVSAGDLTSLNAWRTPGCSCDCLPCQCCDHR